MTQLAHTLKHTIDLWSAQLMETSSLARLTRSGRLPPRAFALYLESLRQLFESSHQNLGHAAQRARSLSLPELAEYLERKAEEEHGHDVWASDDLRKLPQQAEIAPAQTLATFLQLQRRLIEEHPICFVAYALWAEYLTARVGDAWLEALASSGFQRDQVTAIGKHLEADREHAARAFDEIDALWTGDPSESSILAAVQSASKTFEAFCDEIYDVAVASA
jgi:hypothetical protein